MTVDELIETLKLFPGDTEIEIGPGVGQPGTAIADVQEAGLAAADALREAKEQAEKGA